jgi:hypothetical protein
MPPCLTRGTCLIRLAFAHSFVLRCEKSTRQCCNTASIQRSESGACEGRVYREERMCGQDGGVTVLEHDRVPLRDRAWPNGSEGAKQASHRVPRIAGLLFTALRQRCRPVQNGDGAEMRTYRALSSLAALSAILSASDMRSGPCNVRT